LPLDYVYIIAKLILKYKLNSFILKEKVGLNNKKEILFRYLLYSEN